MKTFLTTLLQCSLSMSIITLLYVAVLSILSKRYAPKWCYSVWLVIAVGWMIPFRPLIKLPLLPAQSTNIPLMPMQLTPDSSAIHIPANSLTSTPETVSSIPHLSMWEISFILWLSGVIFMLVYHIWRHKCFMKMVNRWSESVTTPEIIHLLDALKQEQKIKAKIEYKICSSISSPMMIGFLRPVILMPPIQLSENELTLIVRHELTHFKRYDLWYKTIVLVATILHWFNPLVYFMARATSLQCEIACDEYVLHNADMQKRKQYGETIIAIIRNGKTRQTALSTNFYGGKRGMKNRIASILDSKHKKAGVAVLCIVLAGIILTGASLVAVGNPSTTIANTAFTDDEYGKLLALRFDGYEDMSVSQFQEKVWLVTDTIEYIELLERFYEDVQLEEMKDTNDIAAFLFYELIPLTSENWGTRFFYESYITDYEDADNARFEYGLSLSILNASSLTVDEYNTTRIGVINGLYEFYQGRTAEELQDEQGVIKTIDNEIESLTKKWSNDNLSVNIEYFFIPLMPYTDNPMSLSREDTDLPERKYANATEEGQREED